MNKEVTKISIFRCAVCDLNLDSDYHEMYEMNGKDVCGECFEEIEYE